MRDSKDGSFHDSGVGEEGGLGFGAVGWKGKGGKGKGQESVSRRRNY